MSRKNHEKKTLDTSTTWEKLPMPQFKNRLRSHRKIEARSGLLEVSLILDTANEESAPELGALQFSKVRPQLAPSVGLGVHEKTGRRTHRQPLPSPLFQYGICRSLAEWMAPKKSKLYNFH